MTKTLDRALVRFSLEDAQRAAETWGANCGPGALAAVLGLSLDAVHPERSEAHR